MSIFSNFKPSNAITLYNGDCIDLLHQIPSESVDLVITSPPYCMGKAYEDPHNDIETFREQHERIFDDIYRIVKPNGSICWQIGYHVSEKCIIPLDYIIYDIFTEKSKSFEYPFILRNRIIWTFGHGLNSIRRFSGRHETILWFTKGDSLEFNLDEVRVPQKYPGKRAYKGPHKGELSGNPLGKNPSDVWEIPNVKAKHIEKTEHPCQFPVAIPQRLIKALTHENALVLDPFMALVLRVLQPLLKNADLPEQNSKQIIMTLPSGESQTLSKAVPRSVTMCLLPPQTPTPQLPNYPKNLLK